MIKYKGNIADVILEANGVTQDEIIVNKLNYNLPNVHLLDEFLAWHNNFVVFCDCDTDGLCAASVVNIYMENFPDNYTVNYMVSSRSERGFSTGDVERIYELYPSATGILTVDCGIASVEAVERAKQLGIDVLITDHHEPQAILPDCPIINPKLDERNIFKDFCGTGVIFLAFCEIEGYSSDAIQYAAIATVADLVTLLGDNRYIVNKGLSLIKSKESIAPGLEKITRIANISLKTTKDIGWGLAPLINSASRLNMEEIGLHAIVHQDEIGIQNLVTINNKRKEIVNDIMENQFDNVELSPHAVTMLVETEYVGILGLIAARLSNMYLLPAAAYCKTDDGNYAYSIRGVGVIDFIVSSDEASGGGHEMAGGFSSTENLVEQFYSWHQKLYETKSEEKEEKIVINKTDSWIKIPFDKAVESVSAKERLGPFGMGFPEPIFYSKNVDIVADGKTNSGRFYKYLLRHNGVEVVFYDFQGVLTGVDLTEPFDLAYNISLSSFNYKPSIELVAISDMDGEMYDLM